MNDSQDDITGLLQASENYEIVEIEMLKDFIEADNQSEGCFLFVNENRRKRSRYFKLSTPKDLIFDAAYIFEQLSERSTDGKDPSEVV